jgi:hypothetical protein
MSREIDHKQTRARAASGAKLRLTSSARKSGTVSAETLSLVEALRGSCKGKGSLVEARERDHKRDERAKNKKLKATGW